MVSFDAAMEAYNGDDYETAYNTLLPMAEDGNDEAQFIVGLMYYRGEFVELDVEKAVYWFKRSARQHNVDAANLLMECDSTTTKHTNRF
jgi:TPR repeat protein